MINPSTPPQPQAPSATSLFMALSATAATAAMELAQRDQTIAEQAADIRGLQARLEGINAQPGAPTSGAA